MNKVWIEIEPPESLWVRGSCESDDEGTMRYQAKFCKAGTAIKPQHLGPVVSVIVLNAQGKEIDRKSVTLGVKTDGTLFLQSFVEALSQLEKGQAQQKE